MSIASATAKILLFVFNILFLVTGLSIAIIALLVQRMLWNHTAFVGDTLLTPPMIILIIGIVVCIISIFGCCGVIKENRCCLHLFSGLLFILILVELAVTGYAYLKSSDLQTTILNNMESSMLQYNKTEMVTKSWDILQHDFHCCGIKDSQDWINTTHSSNLPNSCCMEVEVDAECKKEHSYKKGCYITFTEFISSKSCQLATIGIGISLAQLLSVFVSFLLAKYVTYNYEAV